MKRVAPASLKQAGAVETTVELAHAEIKLGNRTGTHTALAFLMKG